MKILTLLILVISTMVHPQVSFAGDSLEGMWQTSEGEAHLYLENATTHYSGCRVTFGMSVTEQLENIQQVQVTGPQGLCQHPDSWDFNQGFPSVALLWNQTTGELRSLSGRDAGIWTGDTLNLKLDEDGQVLLLEIKKAGERLNLKAYSRSFEGVNFDLSSGDAGMARVQD